MTPRRPPSRASPGIGHGRGARRASRFLAALAALVWTFAPPFPVHATADEELTVVVVSPEGATFDDAIAGFGAALASHRIAVRAVRLELGPGGTLAGGPLASVVASERAGLVLALGQGATRLAREARLAVPIVAGLVVDADELRGADNLTGVYLEFPIERQLERLRAVLPKATAIGIVYDPKQNEGRVRATKVAAAKLGLRVEARPVSAARELPLALSSLANSVSVLLGMPDTLVLTPETAREVLLFSFRNRIPFVGPSASWAKAGAIYALHWDTRDIGRQLGELAADLHAGVPVGSLPPRGPRTEVLTLNGKTADQLGVSFSLDVRSRAQQVL